jgi:carboxymethylenebutenolidase
MSLQTATIDVPTPDGSADAYVAAPEGTGPFPGVLLYMDAFGLRSRLEQMADRIAEQGYVVLVPNVFYRNGRAPLIDTSELARPENREKLFEALRPCIAALTPELAMRDAEAYLACLTQDPRVDDGPVGVTGYCMGGGLALRTAATYPDRVSAAASFHGGRLATDAENSPHLLVGRIAAEVYVGHADNDASMPPGQQQRLEDALTASGVRHTCELYDGAAHGFTMADTAAYDEAATERHWDRLLDLFARSLRRPPSAG